MFTSASIQVANELSHRKSFYGVSDLHGYYKGDYCCAVHKTIEDVVGDVYSGYVGKVGTHPAIRSAALGMNYKCYATSAVLQLDRAFLVKALSFDFPAFQFSSQRVIPELRKWHTGSVVGIAAFGKGYCYLELFIPSIRFRVARILGPIPLVSDVLLMYRLAGAYRSFVDIRSVAQGFYHCESSRHCYTGRQIYQELLGLVQLEPLARIGSSSAVSFHADLVPERMYCSVCDCNVVVLNHADRCRPVRHRDAAAELIGDAVHALDVKRVLVAGLPANSHYTEIAKQYIDGKYQSAYLKRVLPAALGAGYSDRSWASEFETRYVGRFRLEYLVWMIEDMKRFDHFDQNRIVISDLIGTQGGFGNTCFQFIFGCAFGLGLGLILSGFP